jgi:hypothetical protein
MTYAISTHDFCGVALIGYCKSLEEAKKVFGGQCDDLRYMIDRTVKGVELVLGTDAGAGQG